MCSDEQIELKTLKCMVQRGGLKHVISYVPCFQMLVRGYQINEFCIFPSAIGRRKWAKYHGGMCIWCDTWILNSKFEKNSTGHVFRWVDRTQDIQVYGLARWVGACDFVRSVLSNVGSRVPNSWILYLCISDWPKKGGNISGGNMYLVRSVIFG